VGRVHPSPPRGSDGPRRVWRRRNARRSAGRAHVVPNRLLDHRSGAPHSDVACQRAGPRRRGGFGGGSSKETPYASAELYAPRVHRWIVTGSMHTRRAGHTATLLHTGQVLVSGGWSDWIMSPRQPSAELYDLRTGRWTVTGRMHVMRIGGHTATLLASGKVLVVGGMDRRRHPLASGELYDPRTGTWTVISPMYAARSGHTATLLPSGRESWLRVVRVVTGISWPAQKSMTRARTRGRSRGPCTRRVGATRPRCSPMGRFWSQAGPLLHNAFPAQNCTDPVQKCTTRAPAGGRLPLACTTPETGTRPPCSPTGRSSWRGGKTTLSRVSPVPSCTTRVPAGGWSPLLCTTADTSTRPRCSATARSLWQVPAAPFLTHNPALSCTGEHACVAGRRTEGRI
jgi:Kelch motif